MKLYTEEQVRKAMFQLHPYADGIDWIMKNLTPIELPSDEEIEEYASKYSADGAIIHGAKWMKEQILNQNK